MWHKKSPPPKKNFFDYFLKAVIWNFYVELFLDFWYHSWSFCPIKRRNDENKNEIPMFEYSSFPFLKNCPFVGFIHLFSLVFNTCPSGKPLDVHFNTCWLLFGVNKSGLVPLCNFWTFHGITDLSVFPVVWLVLYSTRVAPLNTPITLSGVWWFSATGSCLLWDRHW
jgi:hypothetical protein